jgi:hypothetical protein
MGVTARFCFHNVGSALLAVVLFSALGANATTTVTAVGGASNAVLPGSTDPTTGTPTTTTSIYGGVAGSGRISGSPQTTTDTCAGATPALRFRPCNSAAINGETILTITVTSTKGGYPVLFPPSTSTSGTLQITPITQPALIVANGSGSVSYRWGAICAALSQPSSDCSFTAGTESSTPSGTYSISVLASPGDTAAVSGEAASIQFTLATISPNNADGISSTTGVLSTGDTGLNEFEVGNGDSKVILKSLNGTGIPSGSHLTFQYVRLLSVSAPTEAAAEAAFSTITSSSDKHDLLISTSTDNNLSLSPARVTGFTNDTFYAFKVGLVDLAGNVGYFTDDSADKNCTFLGGSPATNCHVGHPGEVVGVLSKDLTCFVATAAFGSQMAPQVQTFREFRNRFLLNADWGRQFVRFYYAHSPKYAHIIAESGTLRAIARGFLWPLLVFAWLSLHAGLWPAILISLFTLATLAAVWLKLVAGNRAEKLRPEAERA